MQTNDVDLQLEIMTRKIDRLSTTLLRLEKQIQGATITPEPEWCGTQEAAKRLGVSPATIRRKGNAGEIEARGTGKLRQFRVLP